MIPPMNVGPTATKKNVLEQLLDQGMVLVALDARVDGVEVPSHLGRDAQLRLNLSYRFGLPMTVDEWGILATLTFAGVPFNCRFPWRSVFLLVSHVSGQPYLFPDDIPPELLSQATAEAGIDAKVFTSAGTKAPLARPKLQLVQAPADNASAADDDGDENDEDDASGADDGQGHKAEGDDVPVRRGGALRIKSKTGRENNVEDGGADDHEAGASPQSPSSDAGPRVAPALKRRSGRSSRAASRTGPSSQASSDQEPRGPQPVSQPTRVSLSTPSAPQASPPKGADAPEPPHEPTPGGRPRKGSHLRVVR